MQKKEHWQSFGQKDGSEAFNQLAKDEFQESLPVVSPDEGLFDAKAPRRDFLKYLGFSTAAAALAASCEMPVRKSIPFLNKPEDIVPGVANYYATTFVQDGDMIPVLAKVRDGRPIKIEGNEKSTITKGVTNARVQASVLSLYDVNRVRNPKEGKGNEPTFEAIDKKIAQALAGNGSKPIVLLTSTISSPTIKAAIDDFTKKFPSTRQVTVDAVSYSGLLQASEAVYGKRAIPGYRFDKAKVIVSIDADFLGTWVSPATFARQYAEGRRVTDANLDMSRHFQFEGTFSMTGANADERYTFKPSQTGAVVLALYQALGGSVSAPALTEQRLKDGIVQAAKELKAAGGNALVVAGSNDKNVQIVVHAINELIGAGGKTIDWTGTLNYRQGIDADMVKLVDDMNAGSIGALFIFGPNPVYNYYQADKFKSGLAKVPLTVAFAQVEDETATLCQYILPVHHYLESWGDAELKPGYVSFLQPTIAPLFKTRAFATSLLKWSGNDKDYENYFKEYWVAKLGGIDAFDLALQAGISEPAQEPAIGTAAFNSGPVSAATSALAQAKAGGQVEVVLYQKVSIGDGALANNPWLQEMPDPVTRITWDNYAILSPALAAKMNIHAGDHYEVEIGKPTVSVKVGDKTYKLAAIIIPGVHPDVIGVALGYGRDPKIGLAGGGIGQNAYPLVGYDGTGFTYAATDASVTAAGDTYKIAQTQLHNVYEGRTSVIKEATVGTFRESPDIFRQMDKELEEEYGDNFRENGTLYKDEDVYDRFGIAWGMSVDLSACIGCGACVVACNVENNVPVVGKIQVAKAHEMHWIRIDRYFSGDMENPDVVFQPMMCQHCDNAPCENVCPVNATNHSTEGLNQMAYNRCIGTRYCANNCPFKVRRFNWYDWLGADSFPDNQKPLVEEGWIDPILNDMNDPLSRMVLNPDVTVRGRGVMEKCSFCVQRLQEGKLNAKKDSRPLRDGEVRTACAQACPTHAIVFGNANDSSSEIFNLRKRENKNRVYYALEELHVLPNVNYLAKVRNTERKVGMEKEA
ncbi:MAG TPA: TAT-variant-translocated molybdopterin oxidoreductase [Dinghuibacter sp.]|uniref:TAT-variant-translocated molybdopterin oxidoreductase n=1 Tax=Dinghuibacter sp. TaxID=2024697 RepID=UPI002C14F56A|nr:TAT-variant-translocated molybdopterin oxidoreductase [Dinghuibacter sp.]HTJ15015.1 TAT-variant-translocated molybdopterin oxidoreductase [Dinghuibacter sp.]